MLYSPSPLHVPPTFQYIMHYGGQRMMGYHTLVHNFSGRAYLLRLSHSNLAFLLPPGFSTNTITALKWVTPTPLLFPVRVYPPSTLAAHWPKATLRRPPAPHLFFNRGQAGAHTNRATRPAIFLEGGVSPLFG